MIPPPQDPYAPPAVLDAPEPELPEALDPATRGERFWGALIDSLPTFVILLGLNVWCLALRGQTLGKIVLKTKIVMMDGRKPPLWRLLGLRYGFLWVLAMIPGVGNWIPVADVAFIFRRDQRCLHDLIAGTKVVKIGRPAIEMPQPRRMGFRRGSA